MDVILNTRDLLKFCTIANTVRPNVNKKSLFPFTQVIHIASNKESTTLRYMNHEQVITMNIKAECLEDGECNIPIQRLMQYVKYEKQSTRISSSTGQIIINSYKLGRVDHDNFSIKLHQEKIEYPLIPSIDSKSFELPPDFPRRLSYALKCIATEESRPILTGILFDSNGQDLNLISTDGFWLAHVKDNLTTTQEVFKIVVPGSTCKLVSRFMQNPISMNFNKSHVCFKDKDLIITSELIQGNYPQWPQLIPQNEPSWSISCLTPLFHQRINQFPNGKESIINLTNRENVLTITSHSDDFGDTETQIHSTMKGDGKIAINRRYLLEVSKVFSEMKLDINAPSNPVKVTGDIDGLTLVVMPVFVQW